ncbi:hypothetical protein [Neorhizobium alkalisoli]|nr:hypothetical protein [Neorhizobium alkalisoli]
MAQFSGIVTDDSCYILLQRGIVQMTYIGAPYVFQFTDRVTGKGCSVSQSIITVEGKTFFLSDDGFYVLQGGQLQPIGMGKVDRWFLDNADLNQAHLMTVAADPRETLVYWQYVSKSSVTGKPDMMLIFNYHTRRMDHSGCHDPLHIQFRFLAVDNRSARRVRHP